MQDASLMTGILVLGTEHAVCKAYLAALRNAGLWPVDVLYLAFEKRRVTMKGRLTKLYGALRGGRRSLPVKDYSPRWLDGFAAYCEREGFVLPNYRVSVRDRLTEWGLNAEEMSVSGINDRALVENLRARTDKKCVLYCGGGILRAELLGCGKKFIHVHPGVVPEVKGSDGLLWSVLLRDKIGMSAFFMNTGIDTGDILDTREYDVPSLEFGGSCGSADKIARELIDFLDPVYRADLLTRVLREWDSLQGRARVQDPNAGKVYYFMHPELKAMAVRRFAWRNQPLGEGAL